MGGITPIIGIKAKRNLLFIQLVIILMGTGAGVTAPAIPLLGETLGASFSQIGFFMTGYSAAYAIMTIVSGSLSDRLGRKRILLFSLITGVIAATGYYLAQSPWSLLLFRTLEGLCWGTLWPVAEAIVADNTLSANRGRAMGRFSAFYGLGVATGSLLGGYLMQDFNLQAVLPVFPLLSIFVVFAAWIGISEKKSSEVHHKASNLGPIANYWREIRGIWPVCYASFAYSGFLYSLWGLLSVIAKDAKVSYLGIGVIFALFWLSRLIFMVGASQVQEKYGAKKVLLAGLIMVTVSVALLIFTTKFFLILLAVILGGLGTGIAFPLVITMVAESVSPGYTGFGLGFMELAAALGMIIQTAVAGLLGQWGGAQYTYLLSFILCFMAIIIIWIFAEKSGPSKSY